MNVTSIVVIAMLFTLMSCRGTAPTTSGQASVEANKTESAAAEKTTPMVTTPEPKAEAPPSATSEHVVNTPETQPTATMHPITEVKPATSVETISVAHAHKDHAPVMMTGTDPETALRWLKNGNQRFVKSFFRNDGAAMKDVKRLAAGQKPHSIVLSCSDSRVPPEIVFDQKLGELFTVRTAGEVIEPATIGTIEYAVEHLGVRNLIVMGHTNCGAVKAAHATLGGKDAGSENLNRLVKDIHPRIEQFSGRAPSAHFVEEGWANVKGVVKDLMARSKILEEKIKSGEVRINSALYDLETGSVNFK